MNTLCNVLWKDLNAIFEWIEQLNQLNTDKVEPLTSIAETTLRFRKSDNTDVLAVDYADERVGINTTLRRVTVSVSSTEGIGIGSGFYGRFSWGRLHDFVKDGTSAFTAISDDGVTGIKTGPVIIRTRDLKESFT